MRDAALNGASHPSSHFLLNLSNKMQLFVLLSDDDGIARGNDALTLLENRSTYILFLHELYRLQSFLKQRLNEYHVNETILMTFIMQNAPLSIQKINENGKRTIL